MKYQEERIVDLKEELKPLLAKHWDELCYFKDIRPLDIDFDTYAVLSDLGIAKIYTARTDEGKLIGYYWFLVMNNPHFKTWKMASVDFYFIDPDYRGSGIGSELLNKSEEWLKAESVASIVMMERVHRPHPEFLINKGYQLTERIYEKLI